MTKMIKLPLLSLLLTISICCNNHIDNKKYVLKGNSCKENCGTKEEETLVLKSSPNWKERELNGKQVCLPETEYSSISSIYLDKECKILGLWIKRTCGKEKEPIEGEQAYVHFPEDKNLEQNSCSEKLNGAIAEVIILKDKDFYYRDIENKNECVQGPAIANSYLAKEIEFVYREENFPETCDITENTQQH